MAASNPSHANASSSGDILIVDDVPKNLEFLSLLLSQQGYKVRSTLNGKAALKAAKSAHPDLILLDIKMPEMDGYEVCQRLKADPETQDIPVIFLSALDEVDDKVKAFTLGGVDYIPKPFQAEELLARVSNQLKLRAAQAQIQKLNAELEHRVIQRTAQLEQEIGERLRMQSKVLHMATHDGLTGLPNRTVLTQRIAQAIHRQKTQKMGGLALILIECDRLKIINNSLGYQAVDQLLVSMVRRLEGSLESGVLLANYQDDIFAILIEANIDKAAAIQLAQRLQQEADEPFNIGNCSVNIDLHIGIYLHSQGHDSPAYILRDAGTALYQAKVRGVGKIQIFDPEMYRRAASFFEIQNELHFALSHQELELVYQPIMALTDNTLKGAEALVRWHHPQRGLVLPADFIPVAEETDLIIDVDRHILRQACYQLKTWQDQNILGPDFRLQVNLSAHQLAQADFIDYLERLILETQINGQNLALEITEYGLMKHSDVALNILEKLKNHQITVSIDDFGTGYSSLSYLHKLRASNLKVDRFFVNQMETAEASTEMIRAIINLAHDLEMTVTAEGVETAAQLSELTALGCEFAQGYLLGKPVKQPFG